MVVNLMKSNTNFKKMYYAFAVLKKLWLTQRFKYILLDFIL